MFIFFLIIISIILLAGSIIHFIFPSIDVISYIDSTTEFKDYEAFTTETNSARQTSVENQYNTIVNERDTDYYNTYDKVDIQQTSGEFIAEKDESTGLVNVIKDTTADAEILDSDGNIIFTIPKMETQGNQLYYAAGSRPYGSGNYVPNYKDSIYLSKLPGETSVALLEDTTAIKSGFCVQEGPNILKKDERCQQLDKDVCASTSCCVLLGGTKCITGNESGPMLTSHYNDSLIRNRDFYYYQGKCYGNCPQNNP
jgi:hypothetical protein